ncbi:dynactin subunit 2, putative [Plasmodium knowlesi strain H]|uniref:Dynactin subunit 2, putative n=3 Tax=Plasmodium knowlesi TaxID=5850 RepID=A0A5K1VFV6_PLAKH|nr:dynactin subunit 2, putative [Plasmodium knowlesi strain H]OTN66282.1 putative Dynactin subunit 2 [Plasmodium knowlesi]CAA9989878.1 dynactin subunit 2, putative [Plasmodium knowlesi strain H]SBO24437.1 dynactin subunit 2, putative [Plasmodium knowlesi strain H]SBO26568.1 dynactin subunit 2, putative [Plasmodium knowlesi strain H]VVS79352.1 dynactin subunit 2, putative [Plasmodium knowlesi strain H]|eukprot:XP_002259894.1 hypothetical protein, conserved in Plasmodium species [Plasmodium knowlesi strain H]
MNKVGSTNSGVEGEEKDGNDGSDKGDHNTGDEHSAKSEQSGENVLREKTQQNCSEKESEEGTPNDAPNDVPNDVPNDAPKDVDNSHGEEELKLSRAESDTIEKSREEPNAQGSKISTTSVDEEKEEHEINIIASTGDDYTVHEKPPSIVRGESEKDRGKKIRHKSFKRNDTYNEAKKGEINSSRNKKIMKENLKVDMRDFFFTSQEKDVYEYIPDTSNYAICHNEANELYKDVVTMNKHFLDEINVNIYSSPLDTYLSSMLAAVKEDSKQREVNPLFRANSKSENSNNNNNLSDEKKKKEQSDILDESPMNKPLYSYEFYKNKIFKHYHNNGLVIEVDPAKLKYNNSTQYEYDQKVSTNLDDPLSYLQKLKCEVEDITTYINDLANRKREAYDPDNPYEKLNEDVTEHEQIVKKIMHNREPPEILLELFSLKNDIDDMINDDNLRTLLKSEKAEKMASKQGDTTSLDNCKREVVRDILNRLQNWDDVYPKKGEPTDEKNIQKDTRGNSFPKQVNIYTLQNGKEKEIQTAHLLTLERKIADIEKALGIDKMAMLPYDDLNHAILDLYNKLSLLDSIKLESVKKKMQNLQSEFLNLKKFKKDLLNISKDRGNYEESIDELFKILDLWKKTHHIIPNVLARLHQLKRVHDNAQSFSSRLDDLEKQQSKLDETLSLAEQNIKLINSKIDQNVHFLQDTLRKMESEGGSFSNNE